MIELAQHIEALLLENDCVIVPGLGGFIAHYAPAVRVKEENVFLPPTRTIGFNSQLKLNDGVLVQSYMSTHDTSFSDATRLVEKDVSSLIASLHEGGIVDLENIGEIHYNIYGSYEFTPYNQKITTPFLYGLGSFEMREITSLQQQERVLVPNVYDAKEKRTYEISINRTFLRNAVAMIAVVILFFGFSTPIKNTYIQKNNYAQLLPSELFEQIEKQSVVVTPISNREFGLKHSQKNTINSQAKRIRSDKSKISKPIVVKEIKVEKKEIPTLDIKSLSSNNPYHIIVAGGISIKDAEEMVNQLKSKGFFESMALNSNGKIRVSICSFNSHKEATKQMLKLRKNENYKNAWLLAK